MIMESTYGNRFHEPIKDLKKGLKRILNEAIKRGGSIIIPAFAYGRTQELLYVLHELYNDKEVLSDSDICGQPAGHEHYPGVWRTS